MNSLNTIRNLLGDFNAKVGREDIFKPTIGNENLHQISNDNGARVVDFATSIPRMIASVLKAKGGPTPY
jgi:hypothetical protein